MPDWLTLKILLSSTKFCLIERPIRAHKKFGELGKAPHPRDRTPFNAEGQRIDLQEIDLVQEDKPGGMNLRSVVLVLMNVTKKNPRVENGSVGPYAKSRIVCNCLEAGQSHRTCATRKEQAVFHEFPHGIVRGYKKIEKALLDRQGPAESVRNNLSFQPRCMIGRVRKTLYVVRHNPETGDH